MNHGLRHESVGGPRNVDLKTLVAVARHGASVSLDPASRASMSESHSFWRDGWIPFTVFVVIGVLVFVGGILLCKR